MSEPTQTEPTDSTSRDAAVSRIAATDRLLLALDFDGTLSAHTDDPMAARMLPEARVALDALAALPNTWVALVSGRSLPDLQLIAEHTDDSTTLLAGSHGAEFWVPGEGGRSEDDHTEEVALRDELRSAAEDIAATIPGTFIEPKTFGFAVHTRMAKDAATAAQANDRVDAIVAERAPGWRRRTGKNIVEYAFRAEGKDTAVTVLRELTNATAVLFAGDDVTDEDALRSLEPHDLGVHVGAGETAATVTVGSIQDFADLLARLATERASRPQ
jgi:trehalose 6-phosphate phosphatase